MPLNCLEGESQHRSPRVRQLASQISDPFLKLRDGTLPQSPPLSWQPEWLPSVWCRGPGVIREFWEYCLGGMLTTGCPIYEADPVPVWTNQEKKSVRIFDATNAVNKQEQYQTAVQRGLRHELLVWTVWSWKKENERTLEETHPDSRRAAQELFCVHIFTPFVWPNWMVGVWVLMNSHILKN